MQPCTSPLPCQVSVSVMPGVHSCRGQRNASPYASDCSSTCTGRAEPLSTQHTASSTICCRSWPCNGVQVVVGLRNYLIATDSLPAYQPLRSSTVARSSPGHTRLRNVRPSMRLPYVVISWQALSDVNDDSVLWKHETLQDRSSLCRSPDASRLRHPPYHGMQRKERRRRKLN